MLVVLLFLCSSPRQEKKRTQGHYPHVSALKEQAQVHGSGLCKVSAAFVCCPLRLRRRLRQAQTLWEGEGEVEQTEYV